MDGLAPDGGLYLPDTISPLPEKFLKALPGLSFQELGFEIAKVWLGDEIKVSDLERLVWEAFPFDAPLETTGNDIYVLELFHGPTLAFKDFGARFMAQLVGYFVTESERELNILVATSGDTGSAVASGFHQVPGIRVVLLFPSGKISEIQRKQMTTLGGNIISLAIEGTFDDCQNLVKQAFADPTIRSKLRVTSANSINIARLLPQSFYYFRAAAQIPGRKATVFSVPSGNFGNLTAGLIARRMGLSVEHFIAATNVNDVVPQYLKTGVFKPRSSVQTVSNAMDVGNPSNFERMLDLYKNDFRKMSSEIYGAAFTDRETVNCVKCMYDETKYVLDPHGAVALLGLQKFKAGRSSDAAKFPGIFLETAHPAKFLESVQPAIGNRLDIPERLQSCLQRPERSITFRASFEEFRSFLLDLD